MSEWTSKATDILDGHVHMGGPGNEAAVLSLCEATGIQRMALVAIQNPEAGSGLAGALYMKARHPERFLVFAGLNHAQRLSEGRVKTPSLAHQAQAFGAMGLDGLKMIEGKPTSRQRMNVPVTDPYFAEYWACVEELGLPIVWHVNDPEEFWEPDKIPGWAKERNWGYGPEDVTKEVLYAEVDEVLARHPRLKVIFAHFYFLSADLPRASRFLDAHPNVHFDLAPGVEMLYNISRDPEAGREFFLRYADRIVFGTDLWSDIGNEVGVFRAGLVFRWLESEDEYRVAEGADFLLGPPEDGIVRGLALPEDALSRLYGGNLQRLAGSEPKPLDVARAREECERIAAVAEAMSGKPAAETEAGQVAERLGR
jgi:predicted TIM-barrel fold metal-dependent hydrolase